MNQLEVPNSDQKGSYKELWNNWKYLYLYFRISEMCFELWYKSMSPTPKF